MLWDMKKVYEVIEYQRLIKEAEALKYPLKLLRVHMAMYSSDRYVRMNSMVKNVGAAGRGIGAGWGGGYYAHHGALPQAFREDGLDHSEG